MKFFESLSIVIPVRNGLRFIDRCLGSVISETPGAEVVIVENGSNDLLGRDWIGNGEIEIKYHNLEMGNKSLARNLGAEEASREFVTFLDQDDEILGNISKAIQILNSEPVDAVISTQSFAEEESDIPPYLVKARNSGAPLYHPMTFVTRPIEFFDVGGFDSTLHFAEDFDLVARFRQNKKVALMPLPTLLRHFHESNDSRDIGGAQSELFSVIRKSAHHINRNGEPKA